MPDHVKVPACKPGPCIRRQQWYQYHVP